MLGLAGGPSYEREAVAWLTAVVRREVPRALRTIDGSHVGTVQGRGGLRLLAPLRKQTTNRNVISFYGHHVDFESGWGVARIQQLLQKGPAVRHMKSGLGVDRPFEGIEASGVWGSSLKNGVQDT